MQTRFRILCALSLALSTAPHLPAEQYGPQDFAMEDGITDFGDGSVLASSDGTASTLIGALRLTEEGTADTRASFRIPGLAASSQGWTASFEFVLSDNPGDGEPGDGFSFSYGAIPAFNAGQADPAAADAHGLAEEGWHPSVDHLAFEFDSWMNGDAEQGLNLSVNGTDLAFDNRALVADGQLVVGAAILSWDPADGASLSIDLGDGMMSVFANVATPGFTGNDTHSFAFSARNGDGTQRLLIDNIRVTTIPPGFVVLPEPVISEFMADNENTNEDEDCRSSDWLEIFNATDSPINLDGWYLTDDPDELAKWRIPALPLDANAHALIWASGKDQTEGQLHADFSIEKDGGFLALVKPDGVTITSSYTYGQQVEDISYGTLGQAQTAGSFSTATPGTLNRAPQGVLILEKPDFSLDSQVITETVSLELSTDVPDAVIRYTTNGNPPNSASPIYNTPINISNTTRVTARLFAPGKEAGPIRDRTFVRLANNMLNIRSEIPIIIIDSFGVNIDGSSSANSQNPLRPAHAIFIDRDPNGALARPTDLPDFEGRGGVRVRGQTSAGFAKKQYSFETWDSEGNDKDVSIFGFPSESDWIIHAPYSDKTLMRNKIVYDTSREMGYPASRTRFCEVYFNQNGGNVDSVSDYRGVYVFMEKIKGNEDRVNIKKLEGCDGSGGAITGGYIFKKDKGQTVDVTFNTARENHQLAFVEPDLPTAAQRNWLDRHVDRFEAVLHSGSFSNPTSGYRAYIDVESFIDTHIWVETYKNIDGYRLSSYFYKDRGRKIVASPVWDYNLSLGNANYNGGESTSGWYYNVLSANQYPWYGRLFQDPEFVIQYWDRWHELRGGILETRNMLNRIRSYEREIARPALRNFNKWRVLGVYLWPNASGFASRTSHRLEVDWMENWIRNRLNWIDSQHSRPPLYSQRSGPTDTGTMLTITNPNTGGGQIYYTTDGSDPRLTGGAVAASAQLYSDPLMLDATKTIRSRVRTGTAWSPITNGSFLVGGEPASADTLAITEINYRPADATTDETNRGFDVRIDFEFVEIMNTSAIDIDLAGVRFTGGIEFNFDLGDVRYLAPGERAVVVSNRTAFELRYAANLLEIRIAGEFTNNLSNDGETVVLIDASGGVIRSFAYNDKEPWPEGADGDGSSLVLANPLGNPDPSDPLNWRASTDPNGAPGAMDGTTFTGDPNGDVDRNGINDLLQYALAPPGVAPVLPTTALEEFTAANVTSTYMTLAYTRNLAAGDITFRPQISHDLINWKGVEDAPLYFLSRVDNGDGTETITYRFGLPIAWADQTYGRLSVELQGPSS